MAVDTVSSRVSSKRGVAKQEPGTLRGLVPTAPGGEESEEDCETGGGPFCGLAYNGLFHCPVMAEHNPAQSNIQSPKEAANINGPCREHQGEEEVTMEETN